MTDEKPIPPIRGREAIISWFGYWPTFHDAKILELRLGADPVLRLRAFESTREIDAAGFYKLQKHCTVSFWFTTEVELSLTSDIGFPGIVFDLRFVEVGGGLKMEIEPTCGIAGWIVAKDWRVELEPADGY